MVSMQEVLHLMQLTTTQTLRGHYSNSKPINHLQLIVSQPPEIQVNSSKHK